MTVRGPFARLAMFVLEHRRAVAAASVLLTVFAGVVALPPKVDANLMGLLPEEEPAVVALEALQDAEGGVNLLTIGLSGTDEALHAALPELTASLEALDTVQFAIGDVDPELARRVSLVQLEPDDVVELTGRVQGALTLGPALNPIVTQRLMDMGPLTRRITGSREPPGWIGVRDGAVRLYVRPTGSAHDQVFASALMADVRGVLDAADLPARGVEVTWLGGAYRHVVEDVDGIRNDLFWTTFASAALVIAVLSIAFGRLRAVVIVFTPLVTTNLVNLMLVQAFVGHLNTYTSFGTAVLIGLGIDFGVHLYARYREEVGRGRTVEEAIARSWDRVGPPCATAALTSAAGFVALGVADFRGFSQLGLALGVGLIVAFLAMLVQVPLLIVALDGRPGAATVAEEAPVTPSRSTYRLAPIGLMGFVLVTAFFGATRLPDLEFEYDASATRPAGQAYDELSEVERAVARDAFAPVVVTLPDAETLRAEHRRLTRMVEEGTLPGVARVVSVENVLPADQEARLAAVAGLAAFVDHPSLRYLPPPIAEAILSLRGVSTAPLREEDIPASLLTLLGGGREGVHRLLLFPEGNMFDMREADALARTVGQVLPDREAAGDALTYAALYRVVRRDMPIVAVLAFVLVAALTAIDVRTWPRIVGALGALVAGMVWAGAAIQMGGIKLSMVNVVGVPILLGIGVDVIIHLIHRIAEEGPGGVRRALRTTGVAALVSALTTVLSFASLALATNRGVQSLGLLVAIGLTSIFVSAALVLPTAWAAGWRLTGRAPGLAGGHVRRGRGHSG